MRAIPLALAIGLLGMASAPSNVETGPVTLAEKLTALRNAYPEAIKSADSNKLVLSDGQTLIIDDGRTKDHQTKLSSADVEDMLSQIYPLGKCATGTPVRNFDPGRIRNDALMRALYGKTRSEAGKRMSTIAWFGKTLPFTSAHGAAKALGRAKADLLRLPEKFRQFLTPSAGTFNWRNIAGTQRLSAHSFGAAIDINTEYANYWRWAKAEPGNVPYVNRIPLEIVEVFERHGFIWGGKWYHYDTMHFEYRPELIAIGKLAEKRGC